MKNRHLPVTEREQCRYGDLYSRRSLGIRTSAVFVYIISQSTLKGYKRVEQNSTIPSVMAILCSLPREALRSNYASTLRVDGFQWSLLPFRKESMAIDRIMFVA